MDPQTVNGKYAGNREIFSGWKTIAQYLGKGVRTVQRYEREFRLPVRRPAHRNRGASVLATKSELDSWVRSASMRWRQGMLKAPPDVAAYEVEKLQEAVVQMRKLRHEARQLKREFSELQKIFSHQMLLVCNALASNNAQKSNEIRTRGVLLNGSYGKTIETSPETWIELEKYVRRYSHAEFNQSGCPDCAKGNRRTDGFDLNQDLEQRPAFLWKPVGHGKEQTPCPFDRHRQRQSVLRMWNGVSRS